jgi:hypothetical protein
MYEPVHMPHTFTRRRVLVALVMAVVALIAIGVVVVRTMPHPPPAGSLTLDQLEMIIPDAAQTELVAAMVRTRIAQRHAPPNGSAATGGSACSASRTPHTWNGTQQENARTIVQVGMALGVPARGEVVALAAAMQESQLYNLGDLGVNNDHDSLGLFQQRPSMGWGTEAEVSDPVFAATAFYLALRSVPGWESMAVTVAAQSVQRSGYPDAYAQWETDAKVLAQKILCNVL